MAEQTTRELPAYQVVLRPLVTEKGVSLSENRNQYTFRVSTAATKDQIRHAIEDLFSVKVDKVRTQNRRGKPRRFKLRMGATKDWKKAIVSLHSDYRIDFF